MEKLFIEWEILDLRTDQIEKYCHNCGGKVVFKDSLKRRRNANGKDIYEYAIYKCQKGHTWNRLMRTYRAQYYSESQVLESQYCSPESNVESINIAKCLQLGLEEIEIRLKKVKGSWRLDKLLAQNIEDLSRSQIEKYIKWGKILINNEEVKTNTLVKSEQSIQIFLNRIFQSSKGNFI